MTRQRADYLASQIRENYGVVGLLKGRKKSKSWRLRLALFVELVNLKIYDPTQRQTEEIKARRARMKPGCVLVGNVPDVLQELSKKYSFANMAIMSGVKAHILHSICYGASKATKEVNMTRINKMEDDLCEKQ